MNEKQEAKLSKYLDKYGITQEEVNSIFAKKQQSTNDDDDLLDDDKEPSTEEKETEKKEVKETEVKDDGNETEEIKTEDSKEEKKEEPIEEQKEENDNRMLEITNALGGFNTRIDAIEEKINSLQQSFDSLKEIETDEFGKPVKETSGVEEPNKANSFGSLAAQLGAK